MGSRREIALAIAERLRLHPSFSNRWTAANVAIVGSPVPFAFRDTYFRAEIIFDGGDAFGTGLVEDTAEIRVTVRDHSDNHGDGSAILASEGGLYGLCDQIAKTLNYAGLGGLCAEPLKFAGFTRTDFAVDGGEREASAGVRFSFGVDLDFALEATNPAGGGDG